MFLVIGFRRNTRQDQGSWIDQRGRRVDWDYLNERCVASGLNLSELVESARKYRGYRGMTALDYVLGITPSA